MKISVRHLQLAATTIAMTTAILLFAKPSYAGPLVARDLNSPGDKLLTLDTNTGLEFLDPAVTQALSFDQQLQTPFVTGQGFRIATSAEFVQLLTDAGFTNFSGSFNTADEPATENLLDNFLGNTIPPGQPFFIDPPGTRFDASISNGFYSFTTTPSTPPGFANVVGVDYQSAALGQAPQDQARVILSLAQLPVDMPGPVNGGLLVRTASPTPVPEPSTLSLMGVGVLLLIGRSVYRRRSV